MTVSALARHRVVNQQIPGIRFNKPGDLVAWMGAVQAQDYPAALWGVGLRTHGATQESIQKAIAAKKIVRTWPMRGTLHFVAPSDVRWMLNYLTPRVVARAASRFRQLQLADATFSSSRLVIEKALSGGKFLTREAMYALLERSRISCAGQRGIHILWKLAQEGLICFGPHEGKHPTFVLLDEWIPETRIPSREEAIAILARKFFASHGPATLRDFVWWSGLPVAEARTALEEIKVSFASDVVAKQTYWFPVKSPKSNKAIRTAHLLPAFDEFLVGYKDRSAAVDAKHARRAHPGGGILNPTIVMDGRIIGTWKRTIKQDTVFAQIRSFIRLNNDQHRNIEKAVERYAAFLGKSSAIRFER
jgi:hypothetical protein